MKWNIEYVKEAQRDLKRLDPYNRKIILKIPINPKKISVTDKYCRK